MINTKYLLLASACVLLSSSSQASEAENLTFSYSGSPLVNTYTYTTHTPMELEPISHFNSDNAVKLAAVCAVGGGRCNGLGFGDNPNSVNLDKNLLCENDGYVRSCGYGYVKDSNSLCPYNKSYFKCRICSHECASGTLKACNNQQIQTETSTNDCLETCYQCRDKTCAEGGYAASLTSCQNGTAFSFANKTCYKDVSDKTCEDGGYKSDVPTNNVCTAVTYCNKICHKDCYQPACEEGGYKSAVPANNVCTDVTYYGRTCKTDCKQPTCENGGYKSGVPTNYVCSPVSYYGRTCYQNCYQPQCTAGGYLDAQPSGQFCTAETYFGRTCYKQCCDAATYKYDESNCSGDTKLAGNSCGGKFDACETICRCYHQYAKSDNYLAWGEECNAKRSFTWNFDIPNETYCANSCASLPVSFSYNGRNISTTFKYFVPTEAQKNSPETVVTNCEEYKEAMLNPEVFNIRISGHVTCNEGISVHSDYMADKHIYGQNKETDILEQISSKPYIIQGKNIILSNLTIITKSDYPDQIYSYDNHKATHIVVENVDFYIYPNAYDDLFFTKGDNNIYLYEQHVDEYKYFNGNIIVGPLASLHLKKAEAASSFRNFRRASIILLGKFDGDEYLVRNFTPEKLFIQGNNISVNEETLNRGTYYTEYFDPIDSLYFADGCSSIHYDITRTSHRTGYRLSVIADNSSVSSTTSLYLDDIAVGNNASFNMEKMNGSRDEGMKYCVGTKSTLNGRSISSAYAGKNMNFPEDNYDKLFE